MNPELLLNGIYLLWLGMAMIYVEKIKKWLDDEGLWDVLVIVGYFLTFIGFWIAFAGFVAIA